MGCVPLGSFVPNYERAALGALRDGETFVGPVPSQFGFHVIRVDEVAQVTPVAFDDLGDRVLTVALQLGTLTRSVEVDGRYGTWDSTVGRMVPLDGPD